MQSWTGFLDLEDTELLAKRKVLKHEIASRLEQGPQDLGEGFQWMHDRGRVEQSGGD